MNLDTVLSRLREADLKAARVAKDLKDIREDLERALRASRARS